MIYVKDETRYNTRESKKEKGKKKRTTRGEQNDGMNRDVQECVCGRTNERRRKRGRRTEKRRRKARGETG